MTKAYRDSRKAFVPAFGQVYSNQGGGVYECIDRCATASCAIMRNVKSGWTFVAHGVGQYEDGQIDWDYSTSGTF